MEFNHKYYCGNCGRLLIKTVHAAVDNPIEAQCGHTDCAKRQIVCERPLPVIEQLRALSGTQLKEKEFIRKRFIAEKKMLAKYK